MSDLPSPGSAGETAAIRLCGRALTLLGARSIAGFDDSGAEAAVARTLYPGLRDALLSAHPWSFATRQAALAAQEVQPLGDFDFAYALPEDFLRALSAGPAGRGRGAEYVLAEGRLHADLENLVLVYVARVSEEGFPPFFAQALVARLAAEFCLPLTESTSRAESLSRVAEQELARAKGIDAQQDRPPRFEDFPLIGVRGR